MKHIAPAHPAQESEDGRIPHYRKRQAGIAIAGSRGDDHDFMPVQDEVFREVCDVQFQPANLRQEGARVDEYLHRLARAALPKHVHPAFRNRFRTRSGSSVAR